MKYEDIAGEHMVFGLLPDITRMFQTTTWRLNGTPYGLKLPGDVWRTFDEMPGLIERHEGRFALHYLHFHKPNFADPMPGWGDN